MRFGRRREWGLRKPRRKAIFWWVREGGCGWVGSWVAHHPPHSAGRARGKPQQPPGNGGQHRGADVARQL